MKKRYAVLLSGMAMGFSMSFTGLTHAEPWSSTDFLNTLVQTDQLTDKIKNGRILRLGQTSSNETDPIETVDNGETGAFDFTAYGLQSEYTDDDILALGYVPHEIVVKFNESDIDISTEQGMVFAGNFLDDFASGIILTALQEHQKHTPSRLEQSCRLLE